MHALHGAEHVPDRLRASFQQGENLCRLKLFGKRRTKLRKFPADLAELVEALVAPRVVHEEHGKREQVLWPFRERAGLGHDGLEPGIFMILLCLSEKLAKRGNALARVHGELRCLLPDYTENWKLGAFRVHGLRAPSWFGRLVKSELMNIGMVETTPGRRHDSDGRLPVRMWF